MFNPKEKYPERILEKKSDEVNINLPKKTNHFLNFWASEPDKLDSYKMFERNLKLLKWRTLREKTVSKNIISQAKIQLNSKILGLGPNFIIKVDIENISEQPLYNLYTLLSYQP